MGLDQCYTKYAYYSGCMEINMGHANFHVKVQLMWSKTMGLPLGSHEDLQPTHWILLLEQK